MNALLLTALLHISATPAVANDYKAAYQQTEQTGRPLVVLVGADWCPACQAMKQSVMPRLAQQGVLARVSFAVVNTDRDQALAGKLMQGGTIPQLVMYRKTAAGWQRQQLTGVHSVGAITTFLGQGASPAGSPSPANLSRAD